MKYFAIAAAIAFALPTISSAATMDLVFGSAVTGSASSQAVASQPTASGSEQTALVDLAENNGGTGATASDIIGFYIPLSESCTFGDSDCGTTADRGLGGSLTMWLLYEDVKAGHATASFFFEDLDLDGANDPRGFFESVELFDTDENSVAAVTDSDASANTEVEVSGDDSTQFAINLDLGLLSADDYYLKIVLNSEVTWNFFNTNESKGRKKLSKCYKRGGTYCPRNTPEFMITSIHTTPVPLPAAGWMLLAGVGGLAAMRRRKNAA